MLIFLDVRWFLVAAAVLAVSFLLWAFLNFSRDRNKKLERDAKAYVRRRRNGIWE